MFAFDWDLATIFGDGTAQLSSKHNQCVHYLLTVSLQLSGRFEPRRTAALFRQIICAISQLLAALASTGLWPPSSPRDGFTIASRVVVAGQSGHQHIRAGLLLLKSNPEHQALHFLFNAQKLQYVLCRRSRVS